jgi:hypothetical protein
MGGGASEGEVMQGGAMVGVLECVATSEARA